MGHARKCAAVETNHETTKQVGQAEKNVLNKMSETNAIAYIRNKARQK